MLGSDNICRYHLTASAPHPLCSLKLYCQVSKTISLTILVSHRQMEQLQNSASNYTLIYFYIKRIIYCRFDNYFFPLRALGMFIQTDKFDFTKWFLLYRIKNSIFSKTISHHLSKINLFKKYGKSWIVLKFMASHTFAQARRRVRYHTTEKNGFQNKNNRYL